MTSSRAILLGGTCASRGWWSTPTTLPAPALPTAEQMAVKALQSAMKSTLEKMFVDMAGEVARRLAVGQLEMELLILRAYAAACRAAAR